VAVGRRAAGGGQRRPAGSGQETKQYIGEDEDVMTSELDLFSGEFQQCPFPDLAALRRRAPVCRASNGWYVVTTMELARTVLTDPVLFSNAVSRRTPPPPEVAAEVAAIRAQGPPSVPTLLMNDPPQHTRYRRLVTRAFTPRALAWMEPLVERVADELAAALPTDETIDFITAFARPLPIWAISRVLGLPDARRDDVHRWTDAATATIGAQLDIVRWPAVERDVLEMQLVLAGELAQRQDTPRDDLISLLVQAASDVTSDDEPLGRTELVSMTRELMVAGNESSLRLLADIVWQLDQRPQEWQRVRDDPSRADAIVEEAVRLASPSAAVFRHVTRDTTLGGVALPAGAQLVVSLLSANRDESVFPDPDRFLPDRPPVQRHIAFGQGVHACIGNSLARMEARQAVRALARHADHISVTAGPALRYLPSIIVRGLVGLPVRVTRRRALPPDPEDQ
jgi:cytochrome P450